MDDSSGDLRTLLGVLRRRKVLVIAITAFTVGAALFFSFGQTPIYSSTTRVLVKPLNPNQALSGFNYNFLISMGTEAAIAGSPAVGHRAAAMVEANGGSGTQTGDVKIANPADTTFLDITYDDMNPSIARAWAAAYADAYIANRKEQAVRAYDAAASGYDETIADLQKEIDGKRQELSSATTEPLRSLAREQLQTLQQQLTVVQAQRAQLPIPSNDTAQVIDPADQPDHPSSPNHLQNGLLALAAGFAIAVGVAFARDRTDETLRGKEDLDEQLGAPTLGIVPSVSGWRRRRSTMLVARDAPDGVGAEAYRTIRANLLYLARDGAVKTIAVTSPRLGDGKTTSTANLAVSLASTGKRVVAVSCDLRRPRLHDFFGLLNNIGVTDVLRGDAALTDVVQRCGIETLRVVPSGPVPHDPAELLGSDAMRMFLAQLRMSADVVLLDTPPILAVSDALLIAPITDGSIVVVDAGDTTRGAAANARERLEQVGARILGGVINNLDPSTARSYPSYTHSYYSYGYRSNRTERNGSRGNGKTPDRAPEPERIWD
jgi:tyrosine-protein kinase